MPATVTTAKTSRPWKQVGAIAVVSVVLAALDTTGLERPVASYRVGDFADRTLRAPFDFAVPDDEATAVQRAHAARRAGTVVRVSPEVAPAVRASVLQVIAPLLEVAGAAPVAAPAARPASAQESREARRLAAAHRRAVGAALAAVATRPEARPVPSALRTVLETASAATLLRTSAEAVTTAAYARPIVDNLADVTSLAGDDERRADDWVEVVLVTAGAEPRRGREPGTLTSLAAARRDLRERVTADLTLPVEIDAWLRRVVASQLRSNAAPDAVATAERRAAAAAAVLPVSLSFRRNQLIIGEGQLVTRQTVLALDAQRGRRATRVSWSRAGIIAALVAVVLSLALLRWRTPVRSAGSAADPAFWYGLSALALSGISFVIWDALARLVLPPTSGVPGLAVVMAFPAASLAIYTRLTAAPVHTLRLVVAQAFLIGLLWQSDARLAFFVMASGSIGSALAASCDRRQCLLRAGATTGLLCAPLAALLGSTEGATQASVLFNAAAGLASGLLSAFSVLALGPLLESLFGHMTRVRLVELANYQQPLVRRLAETAPGTFQHSIAVAILADAATRAAGGDPLLARVGALYHDVGKTVRPEMFSENQRGHNPHDDLPPLDSARYIIEHVSEGERLAAEHRLGTRLQDFIREHHGTSAVRFFLDRARKASTEVDDDAFRYPGPRPQSLETAVLMLADQIEATARSMAPAEERDLIDMVDRTIARTLADRQLDEAPVTQRQLAQIRDALVAGVRGMAHQRVRYPGQPAPS